MKFQLDWRAYYTEFKSHHGEPVEDKGRLLFPDGWTYGKADYSGPEYPPPSSPTALRKLQLRYWMLRKRVVERELIEHLETIESIRLLQRQRSVPIMQSVVEEVDGKKRLVAMRVDVASLEEGRVAWLRQDVVECDQRIAELQAEQDAAHGIGRDNPNPSQWVKQGAGRG